MGNMAKKLTNTVIKLGVGTLLPEAIHENMADYPVEVGSNFIRWESGKVEAWQSWGFSNMATDITDVTWTPPTWSHTWKLMPTAYGNNRNNAVVSVVASVMARPQSYLSFIDSPPTIRATGAVTGGSGNTNRLQIDLYAVGRWK